MTSGQLLWGIIYHVMTHSLDGCLAMAIFSVCAATLGARVY